MDALERVRAAVESTHEMKRTFVVARCDKHRARVAEVVDSCYGPLLVTKMDRPPTDIEKVQFASTVPGMLELIAKGGTLKLPPLPDREFVLLDWEPDRHTVNARCRPCGVWRINVAEMRIATRYALSQGRTQTVLVCGDGTE